MMKAIVLIALAAAGCAPGLVSGNPAGGIVSLRGTLNGQAKGMALADAHCGKFGKVSRPAGVNDIHATMRFDCVEP